jgi:tetratricopeptide (TPR) repeat protein
MLRALLRSLSAKPAEVTAPRPTVDVAPPAAGPYAAAAEAQQRGDAAAAEAIFRAHLAAHPADTDALATFGGALLSQERFDEAAAILLPALQRFPAAAPLLFNAGSLAQARMQTDEAIRLFRLALAVQPDFAMARFTLSIQLLLKGEYREGLLLLRARNELADAPATGWPRQLPHWEGQSLRGKRLLVWLDWGGLGDELQFARYLPPLAREHRPDALIFVCSEAGRRLYAAIPGVDQALSNPAGLQADYQAALLDLPILYATTLDHMPPAAP